jgi:DNA-binding NarL/FixJ family response regulator
MMDYSPGRCREMLGRLTPRQREVLRALASGAPRKQLAPELGMSENTLRNHCQEAFLRLEIHSEIEAVRVIISARAV